MMFSKKISKFWRKHCKKRKKYFSLLGISFLFIGWSSLESLFSVTTQHIILGILSLILWGVLLWSGYIIYQDYVRIKKVVERRMKK